MILHLVLYQPKATSTAEERGSLVAALEAACHEIPVIQQVRVGKAINLGMGYENRSLELKMEYAAVFQFRDEIDLMAYLAHERHRELAAMFWNVCENTVIVDISAVDPLSGQPISTIGQMG